MISLEDFLAVVNGGTFLAVLVVGTVTGSLFFRDRRGQGGYLYRVGLAGVAFLSTLIPVATSEDLWGAWIGLLVLWLLFGAGIWLGSSIAAPWRRRHDRLARDQPADVGSAKRSGDEGGNG